MAGLEDGFGEDKSRGATESAIPKVEAPDRKVYDEKLQNKSAEELEKYSCAITLADMEMFVFPELPYSLVLANIMSPTIWEWKKDPWFAKLHEMKPYNQNSDKITRLKQYIMDHFDFNLDLETWGLTDKDVELRRFRGIVDEETIKRSTGLFGYEGDKYYFDSDIRAHFGLDRHSSNTLPYWKTETVEAMSAFKYKEGYSHGAGECVSLSALYAAALYVICEVPLEEIYMFSTPLHSQSFLCVNNVDGVMTNNRRVITKSTWFNGTELSTKAQRPLRNEQVTMVANITGFIHYAAAYPEYTIAPDSYEKLQQHLKRFLSHEINYDLILNFLRQYTQYQACFQLCFQDKKKNQHWIPVEAIFPREQDLLLTRARKQLLADLMEKYPDEFYPKEMEGRICLDKFEKYCKQYLKPNKGRHDNPKQMKARSELMNCSGHDVGVIIRDLTAFAHIEPRLPELAGKTPKPATKIELKPGMTREEIIAYLSGIREQSPTADLAFYAGRDLAHSDWRPFMKAALERNPVCIKAFGDTNDPAIHAMLNEMPNESIYTSTRAAQPDEVWNFQRGDGFEKAVTHATIWKQRNGGLSAHLRCFGHKVELTLGEQIYTYTSTKGLTLDIDLGFAIPDVRPQLKSVRPESLTSRGSATGVAEVKAYVERAGRHTTQDNVSFEPQATEPAAPPAAPPPPPEPKQACNVCACEVLASELVQSPAHVMGFNVCGECLSELQSEALARHLGEAASGGQWPVPAVKNGFLNFGEVPAVGEPAAQSNLDVCPEPEDGQTRDEYNAVVRAWQARQDELAAAKKAKEEAEAKKAQEANGTT